MNSILLRKRLKQLILNKLFTSSLIIITQVNLVKASTENILLQEMLLANFMTLKISCNYIKKMFSQIKLSSFSNNYQLFFLTQKKYNKKKIINFLIFLNSLEHLTLLNFYIFNKVISLKNFNFLFYYFFKIGIKNFLNKFFYKIIIQLNLFKG